LYQESATFGDIAGIPGTELTFGDAFQVATLHGKEQLWQRQVVQTTLWNRSERVRHADEVKTRKMTICAYTRATRWTTTLSLKVILPLPIDFKAVCGASLVAYPADFRGNEIRVAHRVGSSTAENSCVKT